MKLFQILQTLDARITPESSKVHLAAFNGKDDPKDIYLKGEFEEWQSRQSNRNFERPYVVSLIRLPSRSQWLFAGCYERTGDPVVEADGHYRYSLKPIEAFRALEGRLVMQFEKNFRQSYPFGETVAHAELACVYENKLSVSEFNGFRNIRLPFNHLESIVKNQEPTWRGALSSVFGVYVISDPGAGKLYVGSAYGAQGIWGRWSEYVSGHGNNKMLKELVAEAGIARAAHFWFSVLETMDFGTDPEAVIARENHWKEVLLTRQYGYNAN